MSEAIDVAATTGVPISATIVDMADDSPDKIWGEPGVNDASAVSDITADVFTLEESTSDMEPIVDKPLVAADDNESGAEESQVIEPEMTISEPADQTANVTAETAELTSSEIPADDSTPVADVAESALTATETPAKIESVQEVAAPISTTEEVPEMVLEISPGEEVLTRGLSESPSPVEAVNEEPKPTAKLFDDDIEPESEETSYDLLGSESAKPVSTMKVVTGWSTSPIKPKPSPVESPAQLSPLRGFQRIPDRTISTSTTASSTGASEDGNNPLIPRAADTKTTVAENNVVAASEPTTDASSARYAELPPELIDMADRFVESVHQWMVSRSLSPEELSEQYQGFYTTVQDKTAAILRRNNLRRTYEVQMLSYEEIAKKKRERRHKEAQKLVFEELVEKKVCYETYDEIFVCPGSDDEAKDATLSSKIAALKLMNVGMQHLGVPELKDADIAPLLLPAETALKSMVEKRSPKEKLALLMATHKHIVDMLSHMKQTTGAKTSSSADFVLPVLIFAVIQADPPCIYSNLSYIQRFRSQKTNQGETAYCLTNFAAVVAFLETVDLTTLKFDPSELANVPTRPVITQPVVPNPLSSPPPTPSAPSNAPSANTATRGQVTSSLSPATRALPRPLAVDTSIPIPPNMVRPLGSMNKPIFVQASQLQSPLSATTPTSQSQLMPPPQLSPPRSNSSLGAGVSRRLSALYPTEIASSAVNTADQGFKSLGGAFENSYKFLFGGKSNAAQAQKSLDHKPVQMKGTANAADLEKRTQQVLESTTAVISTYAEGTKKEKLLANSPSLTPTTRPSLSRTSSSASSLPFAGLSRSRATSNAVSVAADTSDASVTAADALAAAQSPQFAKIPVGPAEKFMAFPDTKDMKDEDVSELLGDYKRLVDYLKSISAFEE
ncbi:uncharacterized protein V1518DRAFT_425215 [Limtongia smithiae]|uniref:uncharacterized protein n=1 Tax=Limtongia smithiae TaxID=1125753 RepID=UPI0034CD321A